VIEVTRPVALALVVLEVGVVLAPAPGLVGEFEDGLAPDPPARGDAQGVEHDFPAHGLPIVLEEFRPLDSGGEGFLDEVVRHGGAVRLAWPVLDLHLDFPQQLCQGRAADVWNALPTAFMTVLTYVPPCP